MSYYAHYSQEKNIKQSLAEHLHAVSKMAVEAIPPTVHFPELSNQELKKLIQLEGIFHDFGKYTDFFQTYLLEGKISELKGHAHISACFFYPLVLDQLPESIEKTHKFAWAFLFYLAVRLHHSHLTLKRLFDREEMWEVLKKQADHLLSKGVEVYQDIGLSSIIDFNRFCEFLQIDELKKDNRFFLHMPNHLSVGRLRDVQWYFALIYLFSLLIDADKWDSAGLGRNEIKRVGYNRVSAYLSDKHGSEKTSELIERRENARKEIMGVIHGLTSEVLKSQHFFTLTAPTGIGKTLASLQCALALQERIHATKNYTPRIITAIPFINIIEQTQSDYKNVFGDQIRVRTHHRLTDFSVRNDKAEEEIALDQRLMEVESWEADVIVTTFVQLFQSLLCGENRLLKKVNKLAGSIVILDEIQAIPDKYMPLIGALLRKLSHYYGTRFILMTATQPKLLELGDQLLGNNEQKPIELLPNHEHYFQKLNRTQFVPLLEERYDNEQFISLFLNLWNQQQSALIVVNTVKRSIDLFHLLKMRKENGDISPDVHLHYLSTNIVPKDRKKVIFSVKEKLRNKLPVILVSTQTIEAGVDLDFDIGFRDLAPIESLVQTAGRINREGRKGEYSPLYIVQLEEDHQRIYKLHHLDRTKRLLKNKKQILEPEYRKIIESYYKEMIKAGIPDESRTLWNEGVVGLDFDKLKEFQLIEKLGEVVDVFVEFEDDHESTLLADAYEELMQNDWKPNAIYHVVDDSILNVIGDTPSPYDRKALLHLILAKMSNYMVQIRVKRIIHNRPLNLSARNDVEAKFFWIPPSEVGRYYDRETGFKDESGEAFVL
ncbi:CRISPR-associated helicase Cas3' [Microaerobacter geothermalis]|uniref:CRISPR-associated helicase Cas3' n=1 Tax=Microaerobacter geothermalis TaxID=674972 RepID=UPI001F28997A|nr:CRISPR-associated helicase Cas3' [Microaerobacter geothermalis]MCF6094009.1 CRISPR-associated helicase Cas3' [Microaerobacter geothermalis]